MRVIQSTGLFTRYKKYDTVRELGQGFFGTTYLVNIASKNYALKRLKVKKLDVDILTRKKKGITEITNEIFNLNLINNKKGMLKYYGYRILKCVADEKEVCSYKYKPKKTAFLRRTRKQLLEYNASPYIIEILLEFVDGKPFDETYRIPVAQHKKWLFDLVKQIKILLSLGITHNDIHGYNILVSENKAVIIDYGGATNPDILKYGNYRQKSTYNYNLKSQNDFCQILQMFSHNDHIIWNVIREINRKDTEFDVRQYLDYEIEKNYAEALVKISGCRYFINFTIFGLFYRKKMIELLKNLKVIVNVSPPAVPLKLLCNLFLNRYKSVTTIKKIIFG
jgi:serine/threonine protein kinase